jgi:uncharacterized OB-fold protein
VSAGQQLPEPNWAARPRPARTRDTDFWWDGLAAGELRIQKCLACARLQHPPEPLCQTCGSDRLGWTVACGLGRVFSFVVYHEPRIRDWTYPYVVAVVALDEGTRVIANLTGASADEISVGDRVQARFPSAGAEHALLAFEPVSS